MRDLRSQDEIMASWKGEYDKPLVSICCITYNHEPYIEDALEGFLIQQTDFPFEILIHDDASTDKTAGIIQEYVREYPNLIKPIYQTENQYSKGKKINPEFNFVRARGDYIAICEGDDYWVDTKKLQKQIDYLTTNPDYVLTFTDARAFNLDGFLDTNFGGATRDLSADELIVGIPIKTLTSCFRNVFLGRTWPAELKNAYYGDLTIWSLLGDHGSGKYMHDISPSMYRVHDGSLHSSLSEKIRFRNYLQTLTCLYLYRLMAGQQREAKLVSRRIVRYLLNDFNLIDVAILFTKQILRQVKTLFQGIKKRQFL